MVKIREISAQSFNFYVTGTTLLFYNNYFCLTSTNKTGNLKSRWIISTE